MHTELREFDGIELHVIPDPAHTWLLSTQEVAKAYGVTEQNLREHKRQRPEELLEGRHWITVPIPESLSRGGASNPDTPTKTLWTQKGVVRLGFFIRSEQAKRFRDWAEDLILEAIQGAPEIFHRLDGSALLDLIKSQDLARLFHQAGLRNKAGALARGFLETFRFPEVPWRPEPSAVHSAPHPVFGTCTRRHCADRMGAAPYCSEHDCAARAPVCCPGVTS